MLDRLQRLLIRGRSLYHQTSMTDLSISEIETYSGVEKDPGETRTEYIERICSRYDIEPDVLEGVRQYFQQKVYSPTSNTEIDEETVERFVQQVKNDNEPSKGGSDQLTVRTNKAGSVGEEQDTQYQGDKGEISDNRTSREYDERISDLEGYLARLKKQKTSNKVLPRIDGYLNKISVTDYIMIGGIFLIGSYVFLQYLGYATLQVWDESIYANVARHMVQNGDWIVPHLYVHPQRSLEYQPFLEKPPLVFWLQGLSMLLFGVTRFAARLPIALLAILSGIVVYLFGNKIFDRESGLVAVVVLFTTPMIFSHGHGGRTSSTDIPLLFFGTVFVYLTWIALSNDRNDLFPLIGLAAGLALLTKGFNAGVFVIAVAPLAIYNYRLFISRKTVTMVGITSLLVLPWGLYTWYKYPQELLRQLILEQVVARATGTMFLDASNPLFPFMKSPYFRNFPSLFDPWVYLLIPAVVVSILDGMRRKDTNPVFLTWWAGSTFTFFVFTGNHPWYIMPMFVPCALLIGRMVSLAVQREIVALAGLGISSTLLVLVRGLDIVTTTVLIGITIVFLAPRAQKFLQSHWTEDNYMIGKQVLPLLTAALVVCSLVGTVPLGLGGPNYSWQEDLGKTVNQDVPEDQSVAIGGASGKQFPFSFHAQRPLVESELSDLNQDPNIRYALVSEEMASGLNRDYTVIDRRYNHLVIRLSKID